MLSLGQIEKGDWLCVNLLKQAWVGNFHTEDLMRKHWEDCHGIPLTEKTVVFQVLDGSKEPVPE